MNINKISRFLYGAARASRDINAVSRGPKAVGNRIGRKLIGRMLARLFK